MIIFWITLYGESKDFLNPANLVNPVKKLNKFPVCMSPKEIRRL